MKFNKRKIVKILYKLPFEMRKTIYNIYDYYWYPELREKRVSFGEKNKNKTFYVIRPYTDSNEGLMSLLLNVCRHIIYAEKKGYIPVVDFKNYKTQYKDERETNIWEDYFEPISDYSLDEVYDSKKVILCGLKPTREKIFEPEVRFDREQIEIARRIVKSYIRINERVREKVIEEECNIDTRNSIGVYLRGTDYFTGSFLWGINRSDHDCLC